MTNRRTLVGLFAASVCFGQKTPERNVLAVADDLRACVLGLAAGLDIDSTLSPAISALRTSAATYAQSLTRKTGVAANAPPEYMASATALLNVCQPMLISFGPGSPFAGAAKSILEALYLDLSAKAADAQNNGSARMVPVEVQALRGGKPDDGWAVVYQWLPGPAKQLQFPMPTPRAMRSLPPGAYLFRAEKVLAGRKISSDQGSVAIGGSPTAHVTIRVP